jgi:polysaccharide lyase-like protein
MVLRLAPVLASAALGLFLLTGCELMGAQATEEPASGAGQGKTQSAPQRADEGVPLAKDGGVYRFKSDLEGEDDGCWGDRLATGFARKPCGNWSNIGPTGTLLAADGPSRSGRKALQVTFDKNESRGGATLTLSADAVHVRAWYRFDADFDFGQGIKVGRIRSFNPVTESNDIDIIMAVRSSGDADQCGRTDMADLGLFYNGKPAGYDWGHLIAPVRFERERWYAVEYAVALNTPGKPDGSIRIWVDGKAVGVKEGIDFRGKAGMETKLNKIMLGGWYSNSALGNACADPNKPSTLRIDDVAVGSAYLGLD